MYKSFSLNIFHIFLFITLIVISIQFFNSRSIKIQWQQNEAYLMRFQWLDSVNLYLKTGKILMLSQDSRLEDLSTGEDQGYPLVLSFIGRVLGMGEMTFGAFIKFNYLLLFVLGIFTSILLFLSFNSLFISIAFYFLYLQTGIYDGGIDHHWMIGAYVPFYIAFIIFFFKKRKTFKHIWFLPFFLAAGFANIIREGDGVLAIILLTITLIIISIPNILKINNKKFISRSNLQHLAKVVILVILFGLIYLTPALFLDGVRTWRNIKYFNGQSSNMITHHGIWHNAFMGLGYIQNKYGIEWNDANPIKFVHQVNPNVGYMTNEYYRILRNLYFKYSFESPDLWLGNILAKAKAMNDLIGQFTLNSPGKFLPIVVRNYFLCFALIGILIMSKKEKISSYIFMLILAALIVSSLPGFIGTPNYLYLEGLQSAFFVTWFYLFSLIYLKFRYVLNKHYPKQILYNFI